jgi:hypothetical protein
LLSEKGATTYKVSIQAKAFYYLSEAIESPCSLII